MEIIVYAYKHKRHFHKFFNLKTLHYYHFNPHKHIKNIYAYKQ